MPTNRRYRRQPLRQGAVLTPVLRSILSSGHDFFGDLDDLMPLDRWGRKSCDVSASPAAMDFLRKVWNRHKADVLAWHIQKHVDGSRPWGWWTFGDSPEPRPHFRPANGYHEAWCVAKEQQRIEEIAVLIRHDLLSSAEQEAIKAEAARRAALREDAGNGVTEQSLAPTNEKARKFGREGGIKPK